MDQLKIVAHYLEGQTLRGTTVNFWPTHPTFHLQNGESRPRLVSIEDLKAVFVVRDFESHRGTEGLTGRPSTNSLGGKAVRVKFTDGEVIFGSVMEMDRQGLGFFLFPFDPNSNNLRIFVVNRAVEAVLEV